MESNFELLERRRFLQSLGLLSAVPFALPTIKGNWLETIGRNTANIEQPILDEKCRGDDSYWEKIRKCFYVSPDITNLNNGGTCPHSLQVQEALFEYDKLFNGGPQYYKKILFDKQAKEEIRKKLAGLAGCSHDEIAVCRNATEALENVIFGLNLNKGDEVITTNHDYPSMLNALHQRQRRDGIVIAKIELSLPTTDDEGVVKLFEQAITKKTKLILVSHVLFTTGQILPVQKICDMAHVRNIEVLVDAAHSFAHFDYKIPDLHCDYLGTSLHKWLCGPLGSGMLYIKKDKIPHVWPLFAPHAGADDDNIRKFEGLGTRSWPTELAIGTAVDFHNEIGPKRKETRLRFLKDYWTKKIAQIPGAKFYTPLDAEHSCAIANFAIEGVDHFKLSDELEEKYKLHVQPIKNEAVLGIRVSPNVYTSPDELDRFVNAVKEILS